MAFLKKFKKRKEGFTLVELMIVVVILGILAVIAIPTFQKFMIRAKEGEASVNIMALARGARTYFYSNDQKGFPRFSGTYMPTTTPSSLCSSQGHNKYTASPSLWEREPWRSLRFNISTDHYYQYYYYGTSSGRNSYFYIRAFADMDCDGTMQTYSVYANIDRSSGEVRRYSLQQYFRGE